MFALSLGQRRFERANRAAICRRRHGLALLVLASLILPRLLPWVEIYVHRGHSGHGPCCGSLAGCACPIDAAPTEAKMQHHEGHSKPLPSAHHEPPNEPEAPSCHDDNGQRFAHCGEHPGASPPERILALPTVAKITVPTAVGRASADNDSHALDGLTAPPTPPPDLPAFA